MREQIQLFVECMKKVFIFIAAAKMHFSKKKKTVVPLWFLRSLSFVRAFSINFSFLFLDRVQLIISFSCINFPPFIFKLDQYRSTVRCNYLSWYFSSIETKTKGSSTNINEEHCRSGRNEWMNAEKKIQWKAQINRFLFFGSAKKRQQVDVRLLFNAIADDGKEKFFSIYRFSASNSKFYSLAVATIVNRAAQCVLLSLCVWSTRVWLCVRECWRVLTLVYQSAMRICGRACE